MTFDCLGRENWGRSTLDSVHCMMANGKDGRKISRRSANMRNGSMVVHSVDRHLSEKLGGCLLVVHISIESPSTVSSCQSASSAGIYGLLHFLWRAKNFLSAPPKERLAVSCCGATALLSMARHLAMSRQGVRLCLFPPAAGLAGTSKG